MKNTIITGLFLLLITGCSTLVKRQEGELIAARQNIKQVSAPTKYQISMEKDSDGDNPVLKVTVVQNTQTKETWQDTYSAVEIRESRCKNFFSRLYTAFFDRANLSENSDLCDTKKTTNDTIIENKSTIINTETPIGAHSIKLIVNGVSASAVLLDNEARFDFSALKLKTDHLPSAPVTTIEFNDQHIDASTEFSSFVATLEKQASELQAAKDDEKRRLEVEKNRPENKYKMPFCHSPDLFSAVFLSNSPIEKDCIYGVGSGQPLKVLQVTDDGVIVTTDSSYANDKVIFIKTKKQYVDGDFIQNILVTLSGPLKYQNTLGVGRTVNAFKYLGEVYGR